MMVGSTSRALLHAAEILTEQLRKLVSIIDKRRSGESGASDYHGESAA